MIDGYINISEAAEKWGISTRRVQVLCKNGRIEGAAKLGREWAIPVTAEKPGDDRFVNGKYVAWRKKSSKIRETNTEIKGNQDKLDKWDYAISISSGAITAAMDILWVKDINLFDARTWGKEKVEDFVMAVVKNQKGYSGKNLKDAIKFLEDKYPIAADDFTNDFGGGKQHHLRDFAHHPTIVGLVFSIMTQFTEYGYGTDVDGNFIPVKIAKTDHIGNSFADKIYMGAVSWIFHMVSDMAGSSSSAANQSDGTGIPGPIMSLLKELSAIPGIKHIAGNDDKGHNQFSVECSKLFNGTLLGKHDENGKIIKDEVLKFDLRTEIGIANEAMKSKQYLPVVINEIIVRAFYSVRKFMEQIKTVDSLDKIDMRKVLPFNSLPLKHMLTISTVTFSAIDISSAGIKAALKNKDNKPGFVLDFMQSVNYIGAGRMLISVSGEAGRGLETLYDLFMDLIQKEKVKMISAIPNGEKVLNLLNYTGTTAIAVAKSGTPIGFVSAVLGVYRQIDTALTEKQLAHEERVRIEAEVHEHIKILNAQRSEMEMVVTEYMEQRLEIIEQAFDQIELAILEDNSDLFIGGNNMIQAMLGRQAQFTSQDEFDALMDMDDAFVL